MEWIYRGYDNVGNKGWVYGDLTHNQKITRTGLEPRTMVAGYEVDPKSVGLRTGLEDDKGNIIYEGDIVRIRYAKGIEEGIVEYIKEGGIFLVTNGDCFTSFFYREPSILEIIGNVFENSELLEEMAWRHR